LIVKANELKDQMQRSLLMLLMWHLGIIFP
jgi:hypothetical protein